MLESEKEEMIEIAKDLKYGNETIDKIKKAKSSIEIENIMVSARRNRKD